MAEELELADLVAGLRAELDRARAEGAGTGINFEVGPVEVEVTVSVSKTGTGKTGVRFWVVTAEAGGQLATAATQRIKLTLDPYTTEQATNGHVGKARPARGPLAISGEELPGEQ